MGLPNYQVFTPFESVDKMDIPLRTLARYGLDTSQDFIILMMPYNLNLSDMNATKCEPTKTYPRQLKGYSDKAHPPSYYTPPSTSSAP